MKLPQSPFLELAIELLNGQGSGSNVLLDAGEGGLMQGTKAWEGQQGRGGRFVGKVRLGAKAPHTRPEGGQAQQVINWVKAGRRENGRVGLGKHVSGFGSSRMQLGSGVVWAAGQGIGDCSREEGTTLGAQYSWRPLLQGVGPACALPPLSAAPCIALLHVRKLLLVGQSLLMPNMRTLCMLLILAIVSTTTTCAQGRGGREGGGRH